MQAFQHQVIIPRDPQSGQPTGQRVHKPLMITKVFDKSSPLIFNALTSGERLNKCRLEWYRTSSTGTQEHYFTIELEDAVIVDVQSRMPNCQDPNMSHFTHLEDVYFTYRKIVWTHGYPAPPAPTTGAPDRRLIRRGPASARLAWPNALRSTEQIPSTSLRNARTTHSRADGLC